jgi:hypothetical protein
LFALNKLDGVSIVKMLLIRFEKTLLCHNYFMFPQGKEVGRKEKGNGKHFIES